MKKILLYTLIGLVSIAALTVVFFTVRLGIASAQSAREWQTGLTSSPGLGTTT